MCIRDSTSTDYESPQPFRGSTLDSTTYFFQAPNAPQEKPSAINTLKEDDDNLGNEWEEYLGELEF